MSHYSYYYRYLLLSRTFSAVNLYFATGILAPDIYRFKYGKPVSQPATRRLLKIDKPDQRDIDEKLRHSRYF